MRHKADAPPEVMTSVNSIVDRLGKARIASRVGVVVTAVDNAIKAGVFPARWYGVVNEMCEAEGVNCPISLFNFVASTAANSRTTKEATP